MRSVKTTGSFKIPSNVEAKMNKKLVADGYGLRGKSRWISDAIAHFLSQEEEFIFDCIEYVDDLENLDKAISFRLPEEVDRSLSNWVAKARKSIPTIEGVKSRIIRAAIFQSLLSSSKENATL